MQVGVGLAQSPSDWQPVQTPLLQVGVGLVQSLSDWQPAQTPFTQTGVAPPQVAQ